MQKWEYCTLRFYNGVNEKELDEAGNEGWELVAVVDGNVSMVFVFKRPKNN